MFINEIRKLYLEIRNKNNLIYDELLKIAERNHQIEDRLIHIEDRLIHVEDRLTIMDDGKCNDLLRNSDQLEERLIHIEDKVNELMKQDNEGIYLEITKKES